jgi:methylthioribose-1-phosphate isomerase
MKIQGKYYHSIWLNDNGWSVHIFDQRTLPWHLTIVELTTMEQAERAIKEMWTRGAPLLAMTGAYGMALALRSDPSDENLHNAYTRLLQTRPTAVNLKGALDAVMSAVKPLAGHARIEAAYTCAKNLCAQDIAINQAIGKNGLPLIQKMFQDSPHRPVNILTHCNAGWLATVDLGTATAPIYLAHDMGIPLHVWVDETRPRQQGALLTAYELAQHGVPHTVITDNAGGLLMQSGKVDLCIVGADRVTRNGDVCNKIGTYLKALAAHDNAVPFYVALPSTTYDMHLEHGADIPIEERSEHEVTHISGRGPNNEIIEVQLTQSRASNLGFDITPARLITAYITEHALLENVRALEQLSRTAIG